MFTAQAHAKLNLCLHVTGKRADGYHLLESLVVFTELADTLHVCAAEALSLHVHGPFSGDAGQDADNLVLRAARLLQQETGTAYGAAITLEKRIPVGAGLGGGSADAAVALQLLNQCWGLGLDMAALHALAPRLGADVAMCLHGRPCMASGIGDVLQPVPPLPPLHAVLVHPRLPLLTAEVYRAYMHAARPGQGVWQEPTAFWPWLQETRNDLQPPALAVQPKIGAMLQCMENTVPAPRLVRMTGSGACCFALFTQENEAHDYAEAVRQQQPHWFVAATAVRR